MSKNTIQPVRAFESVLDHGEPSLRRDLKRLSRLNRDRAMDERFLRKGGTKEQTRKRIETRMFASMSAMRDLRSRILGFVTEHGVLRNVRSLVLHEARRLEEIVRHMPYRRVWDELYLVRMASTTFWDFRTPEVSAALETLFETPTWARHERERQKRRAARRLQAGHWSTGKYSKTIKASKKAREKARRAERTPEQVEAERLKARARHVARKAQKAVQAGHVELYGHMLDDQPVQRSEAA